MKTLSKILTATAALLIVAGCTASAQDANTTANSAWGPGWRHEQMVQAWQKGEVPGPGYMRGYGPGMMRGYGPGAQAIGPDGKVDTSHLPPWCPFSTNPGNAPTTTK